MRGLPVGGVISVAEPVRPAARKASERTTQGAGPLARQADIYLVHASGRNGRIGLLPLSVPGSSVGRDNLSSSRLARTVTEWVR